MEQLAPPALVVGWSPEGALRILDQRALPEQVLSLDLRTVGEVADAIRTLAVRGAPAIGVAAAIGLAVATRDASLGTIEAAVSELRRSRPTAVNLGWALDRMLLLARAHASSEPGVRTTALLAEAERIRAEDAAMCRAIGEYGAPLVRAGMRILTHCNAGALATAGIGTALAPLYVAHARGVPFEVFADETRPLLQGSRLTAWELARAGIPVTVLTDGMAASVMARGDVDLVIVGADRIAANGDSANKIGTYGLAVLARHHDIPFVVAAPWSSVDAHTPDGDAIPIEQRDAREVTHLAGKRIAAEGAAVHNPAFDVTPHTLISRIVTDRGVFTPPYVFAPSSAVLPPPA
jgi:methylthioribose-1-phosphate isomerase